MDIIDFMTFDLAWFKSVPGILLIIGCICLLIAVILLLTIGKNKNDSEDIDPREGVELIEEIALDKELPSDDKENVQVIEEPNINLVNIEPELPQTVKVNLDEEIKLEEPKPLFTEESIKPVIEPTPIMNNIEKQNVEEPLIQTYSSDVNIKEGDNTFKGESLLPKDFIVEEKTTKAPFGGEKLLPDDFNVDEPYQNTQKIEIPKPEVVIPKQETIEPTKKENLSVTSTIDPEEVMARLRGDAPIVKEPEIKNKLINNDSVVSKDNIEVLEF